MRKLTACKVYNSIKQSTRLIPASFGAAAMVPIISVVSHAEEVPGALPTIAITQDMLTPLVEGVVANIGVVLPVGLGLFAIMLGIRILPGLISRFVHM